jgi:hypothetical protein
VVAAAMLLAMRSIGRNNPTRSHCETMFALDEKARRNVIDTAISKEERTIEPISIPPGRKIMHMLPEPSRDVLAQDPVTVQVTDTRARIFLIFFKRRKRRKKHIPMLLLFTYLHTHCHDDNAHNEREEQRSPPPKIFAIHHYDNYGVYYFY